MPRTAPEAPPTSPAAAGEADLDASGLGLEAMLTLTGGERHLRRPGDRLPLCGVAPVLPLAASQAPRLYARLPLCPACAGLAGAPRPGRGPAPLPGGAA